MNDRLHALEGVRNFRDFGGYATPQGPVRRGALFRSGHFAEATDRDREQIAALGVALVLDLRRPTERAAQPNRLDGLAARTLVSDKGDRAIAPHIEFLQSAELTPGSVDDWMRKTYRRLPYEDQHIELFSAYFAALAADEGAVVVHCAAGKDRTGILCALTHHVLGVAAADHAADYLLTNAAVDIDARLPAAIAMIEAQFGRRAPAEALRPFLGVAAHYLAEAWAEMGRRDGGVDGYLARLGVDSTMRGAIVGCLIAR